MHPFHLQLLKNHMLTGSFPEDDFSSLLKSLHLHALKPSELLFSQGDCANSFFILVTGKLKLFRTSIEGQEKIVDVINTGQAFAEAVMFMNRNEFPVNCSAIKPSEVIAINSKKYLSLLAKNKEVCFHLMADLSMRLHGKLNEIDTLSLQNATYRVIHFLLSNSPNDESEKYTISLSVSKRLIASQLAIQPETFSRILNKLKNDNIIEVDGKDIIILSRQKIINYQ